MPKSGQTIEAPARSYVAVTPSDSVNIANIPFRGLYVGTTGDIAIVDEDGNAETLPSVAGGITHPLQGVRINSTNTTATNMVALF